MMRHRFLRSLSMVVLAAVALVIFGFVVMHLWNWVMPAVFGLRSVTYAQAVGLLVLIRIFFGGHHRRCGGRRGWKEQMEERWSRMSAEERERMRVGMRGRWGCGFGRDRDTVSEQKPVV